MVILRLNQFLIRLTRFKPYPVETVSTNRLGDWHLSDFSIGQRDFIVGINGKSRLPIVISRYPISNLQLRFQNQVCHVLKSIGIASEDIRNESWEMSQTIFSTLNDKMLIDNLRMARCELIRLNLLSELQLADPFSISLKLARLPIKNLDSTCPSEAVRKIFGISRCVLPRARFGDSSRKLYLIRD